MAFFPPLFWAYCAPYPSDLPCCNRPNSNSLLVVYSNFVVVNLKKLLPHSVGWGSEGVRYVVISLSSELWLISTPLPPPSLSAVALYQHLAQIWMCPRPVFASCPDGWLDGQKFNSNDTKLHADFWFLYKAPPPSVPSRFHLFKKNELNMIEKYR